MRFNVNPTDFELSCRTTSKVPQKDALRRAEAAEAGCVLPGQKVAIKFDTFPYVQYGMAEGTVRFISPDSFSGNLETQRVSVVKPVFYTWCVGTAEKPA